MKDIELVIKIPEDYYNAIKEIPVEQSTADMLIIRNGTPLPKGHGRLIDADDINIIELEDSLHFMQHIKDDDVDVYIDAPTIIEADKTESEE